MGINKFVSTKDLMQEVIMEVGEDNQSIARALFKRNIAREYKDYISSAAFKKRIHVLKFNGCGITLPESTVAIEGMIWGDYGCDCNNYFDQLVSYWGESLFTTAGLLFAGIDAGSLIYLSKVYYGYEISDNILTLQRNFDGQAVTIRLQQLDEDEEGYVKVNEIAANAMICYMRVLFARNTIWRPRNYQVSRPDRKDLEAMYANEKRKAIAQMHQMTDMEEMELSSLMFGQPSSKIYGTNVLYPLYL